MPSLSLTDTVAICLAMFPNGLKDLMLPKPGGMQ